MFLHLYQLLSSFDRRSLLSFARFLMHRVRWELQGCDFLGFLNSKWFEVVSYASLDVLQLRFAGSRMISVTLNGCDCASFVLVPAHKYLRYERILKWCWMRCGFILVVDRHWALCFDRYSCCSFVNFVLVFSTDNQSLENHRITSKWLFDILFLFLPQWKSSAPAFSLKIHSSSHITLLPLPKLCILIQIM